MSVAASQDGPRHNYLARHKPIPAGHLDDRRSTYWVDRQPLGPPTVMAMTPRLEALSKHRSLVANYRANREYSYDKEPFYKEIKRTSSNVPEASPRVVALSAHKIYHSDYQFDRDLPTNTRPANDASSRVEELARSKTELWQKKGGWPNENVFHTFLPQPVSLTARKHTATARVEALAEHKPYHTSFRPERPIRWDISEETLKINASLRVCQLARPRSRNLAKDDDFDPYFVPKAARHATITPRVEELSIPLPRKVRAKKAA